MIPDGTILRKNPVSLSQRISLDREGAQKPGFFEHISSQRKDLEKNPVSLSQYISLDRRPASTEDATEHNIRSCPIDRTQNGW